MRLSLIRIMHVFGGVTGWLEVTSHLGESFVSNGHVWALCGDIATGRGTRTPGAGELMPGAEGKAVSFGALSPPLDDSVPYRRSSRSLSR
jgi:hypothetical protein